MSDWSKGLHQHLVTGALKEYRQTPEYRERMEKALRDYYHECVYRDSKTAEEEY